MFECHGQVSSCCVACCGAGESESDEEGLPSSYRSRDRAKKKDASEAAEEAEDAAGTESALLSANMDGVSGEASPGDGIPASASGAAGVTSQWRPAPSGSGAIDPVLVTHDGASSSSLVTHPVAAAEHIPAAGASPRDLRAAGLAAAAVADSGPAQQQQQQDAGLGPEATGDFRAELQERALARAAARAEAARSIYAPDSPVLGGPQTAVAAAVAARSARPPAVWGTANYRRLWDMAVALGEQQVQERQELDEIAEGRQEQGQSERLQGLGAEASAGMPAGASSLLTYAAPQPLSVPGGASTSSAVPGLEDVAQGGPQAGAGARAEAGTSAVELGAAGVALAPETTGGADRRTRTRQSLASNSVASLDDSVMGWAGGRSAQLAAPGAGGLAAPGGLGRHLIARGRLSAESTGSVDLDSARANTDRAAAMQVRLRSAVRLKGRSVVAGIRWCGVVAWPALSDAGRVGSVAEPSWWLAGNYAVQVIC